MPYLTIKDVAAHLQLSERTVYKLVRKGALPAARIGGVYRIDSEELDKWAKTKGVADESRQALRLPDDNEVLERIAKESDPLKKRLLFIGLVTGKLAGRPAKPVVVGGLAVEFYTAGGYATADIDLVYPSEPLDEIFQGLGLGRDGRYWFSEELGIVVEAPSAFLDVAAKDRCIEVRIDDFTVFLLGVEDLIIDRLNAFAHWGSADDGTWARELITIHKADIDWPYLKKSAVENKVDKELEELS